jgi:hypothetical protein
MKAYRLQTGLVRVDKFAGCSYIGPRGLVGPPSTGVQDRFTP